MRRGAKRNLQTKDVDEAKVSKKEESNAEKESLQENKLCDIEDLHRIHIDRIKLMRAGGGAPVDTMGCSKLADPLEKPEVFRFQVLVALMLSSQTKDQTNAYAMTRLKEHGLSLDSMRKIDQKKLETLLIPVSFYRRKADYIKRVVEILQNDYNGDIPPTVEDLCALPGVGPKMAHLVMQIAWNKTEGVAVDVHVHRIANRLGWMKTKTPEQTREKMQEMLPRCEWSTINPLLVGFGQTICQPVRPKCRDCLCNTICPSSTVKTKDSKDPLII